MKRFFACLLLCMSALAGAQTSPCGLPPPQVGYVDLTAQPTLACVPGPVLGMGTAPTFRSNSAGTIVWWYCPQPDGSWSLQFRAATAAVLTPSYLEQLLADIASASVSASPTATLNGMTTARINLPLSDPSLVPVWCPWWPAMYTGVPASFDGSTVPPAPYLSDGSGVHWTILPTGFAARDGVATNGHATQIELKGGQIYVKSPTGGYWWQWLGPNQWLRLTTTMP